MNLAAGSQKLTQIQLEKSGIRNILQTKIAYCINSKIVTKLCQVLQLICKRFMMPHRDPPDHPIFAIL